MPLEFSTDLLPLDVEPADTLYVIDRELNVVYSNEEWARFAADNNGLPLLRKGWNKNVLANMSGKEKERWKHIYRLLLDGRLPHHQEPMNCASPVKRRSYQLRITPEKDEMGEVAWLVHHNVRLDTRPDAMDRVSRQLEQLDDPEQVTREFRKRIVERKIRIPSFAVARHFEPLEEIGGDLVWHREYPEGISDMIHADVMGHGAEAGRVAAKMAVMLDELATLELRPGRTAAALNRALTKIAPMDGVMFATGLHFRFEQDLKRVTCCSFGHDGPIFSRTGPIQIESGFPVGLAEEDEPWPENSIDLTEHGKRFLVFSDGITEQFNAEGEMFGIDGLYEAFLKHIYLCLDEMVNRIVKDLTGFRGTALVKDDQTLLALDFVG
jgi:sigma-B regulation protein RsbU (phosphoserine phosphatase)